MAGIHGNSTEKIKWIIKTINYPKVKLSFRNDITNALFMSQYSVVAKKHSM